jgi:glycosyltransferase involved in cell wall biosynthesis
VRIAQVVCTNSFAGVERYVTTLSGSLAAEGCEVVVIGGQQARMTAELGATGVRWLRGARVADALAQLIRLRRLDIIHAHMTTAELAAVTAVPFTRARVVATRHFAQRRGSSAPARALGRLITPRMAAQFAISRYVGDRTEGPSLIVPPGSPEQPGGQACERRQPVVLIAQRLESEKRTDLALRVWQQSGLGRRGWRLDIAGEGGERQRLEQLASDLNIVDSCRFLGVRDDIDEFFRQASILLAPRPDEPFGLSVIEAMAAGLPVVAAGGGGHLETVGLVPEASLYPPEDFTAGGQLLAQLADDPARRASYGVALRLAHREAFSMARQVSATLDVYRSVLQ